MRRLALLATVAALVMAVFAPAATADPGTFDLTVKHRINGQPLGLDRDLPVDVYVNGGKAFTFSLADTVEVDDTLVGGTYDIEVYLAGSDPAESEPVLSLYDAEIPAGADVLIIAKRTGPGIGLKVVVR